MKVHCGQIEQILNRQNYRKNRKESIYTNLKNKSHHQHETSRFF